MGWGKKARNGEAAAGAMRIADRRSKLVGLNKGVLIPICELHIKCTISRNAGKPPFILLPLHKRLLHLRSITKRVFTVLGINQSLDSAAPRSASA